LHLPLSSPCFRPRFFFLSDEIFGSNQHRYDRNTQDNFPEHFLLLSLIIWSCYGFTPLSGPSKGIVGASKERLHRVDRFLLKKYDSFRCLPIIADRWALAPREVAGAFWPTMHGRWLPMWLAVRKLCLSNKRRR
jgi:hypothetical protein